MIRRFILLLLPVLLPVLLALSLAAPSAAAPLVDTPTPTPSATPGPGNQPVAGFYIPKDQAPPWDVPIFATWGTGTPQPTLYAATPPHATDYPGQVGTATAQIYVFTGPISSVATPVAGLLAIGPTETSGDISTGLDPLGTGTITFSSIGDQIEDGIADVVGPAKVLLLDLVDLATYSAWLVPVPLMLLLPPLIGMFLAMIILVIKAVEWLVNLVIKIFTFIGVWKPG